MFGEPEEGRKKDYRIERGGRNLLMFGAAFLIVTCLVSVFFLKKRIKYLEDTIWGMQIYICEKTGDVMDEEQIEHYRDYWKRR